MIVRMETYRIISVIKAWLGLSRLPFHSVGLLPFILGTLLAWKYDGTFNPAVFILGLIAVALIMLSTYQAGEYYDYREDVLSKSRFNSKFSGGSGVIQSGLLPKKVALWTSIISFFIAALIGVILQFFLRTGPYTLILGAAGAFSGLFYSTKPIRLVERGFGEIFIGFCYGWLPVAAAFYIQTGFIHPIIHWVSIPIGFSIFNVILLNEFPDYPSDKTAGKRNLLVRFGKDKGVVVYSAVSVLAWLSIYISVKAGVPMTLFYICLPFILLSAFITFMMWQKSYTNLKTMEMLCGLNIAVNLGYTASYIFSFILIHELQI